MYCRLCFHGRCLLSTMHPTPSSRGPLGRPRSAVGPVKRVRRPIGPSATPRVAVRQSSATHHLPCRPPRPTCLVVHHVARVSPSDWCIRIVQRLPSAHSSGTRRPPCHWGLAVRKPAADNRRPPSAHNARVFFNG